MGTCSQSISIRLESSKIKIALMARWRLHCFLIALKASKIKGNMKTTLKAVY